MRVAVDGVYFGLLANRGPEGLMDLARDVGADGLNWPFHAAYGADDPGKTAAALRNAGLAVVSLGFAPHISAVPGRETEFRELLTRSLEVARALGTRVIDCWPARSPEVSKEQAQAVLAANLAAVAPAAEAAGCVISLEFEPDTTLERFGEALDFLSPPGAAVRLTADTYHIIRIGDSLEDAASALGTRIGIVHISGSHRGEPGSEGDRCDHAAFVAAACRAGYAGDLVLQYATPQDTVGSLKRSVALARSIVPGRC